MASEQQLTAGIDITPILYGRGVSRYTANLINALQNYTPINLTAFGNSLRRKNELIQFAKSVGLAKKHSIHRIPPRVLSLLWYQLHWPDIQHFLPNIDVYHAWEEYIPPSRKIPVVATIHDVSLLKYPQVAHPATRYKHLQAWKQLKQLNAHLIAVSQSTKADILKYLDIPSNRVHVIYEALPEERKKPVEKSRQLTILEQFGLSKPYLLWVGTQEPRKNLPKLVEAWQSLAKEVDLVLAGGTGWGVDFKKFKHQPTVLGFVTDEQLTTLYQHAAVFMFPSLDEGFALPILEAYYHQVPVVTSNRSAMKEVAGNAAVLVNPESSKSITQGIDLLLNEQPMEKKRRTQAMTQRLQIFNWQQVAQATYKVYQQAVQDYK